MTIPHEEKVLETVANNCTLKIEKRYSKVTKHGEMKIKIKSNYPMMRILRKIKKRLKHKKRKSSQKEMLIFE